MKISVIVPVYKVPEQYLRNCIKSLISQSYSDLEIILVDDGSPDDCGKIIDEYKECDSRLKCIHQLNQGVSVARNQGLSVATGEYILFVDGDDCVEPEIIQKLAECLSENQTNILYFYYRNASHLFDLEKEQKEIVKLSEEEIQSWFCANIRQVDLDSRISIGSPWGKVFSTEFLKRQQLQFPISVPRMQDRIFIAQCLSCVKNVSYVNIYGYIYNDLNNTSATRKYNPQILPILELAGSHLIQTSEAQEFLDEKQKSQLHIDLNFRFMTEWLILSFLHKDGNLAYKDMKSELLKTYQSDTFQYLITKKSLEKEELKAQKYGFVFDIVMRLLYREHYLLLFGIGKLFRTYKNLKRNK